MAFAGCAHQTVIHTVPEGAEVYVDDEYAGEAPVVVERFAGTGGQLRVRAEMESFLERETVVERTEWFLWPALLAATPVAGIPLAVLPVVGPFLCGGWMVATSPTLCSLFFLRVYPPEVTVTLAPRIDDEQNLMHTDDWMVPDEYSPNPLPPLPSDEPPDGAAADEDGDEDGDESDDDAAEGASRLPPEPRFRY